MNYPIFSSESVCEGHPDKICDQISDAILDESLKVDRFARVAIETLVTKNQIILAGEVKCRQKVNYLLTVKKIIKELNYSDRKYDFSENSDIKVLIHEQSNDIALGVDNDGAGDQGMMFGYACRETNELMPLPIMLSHELCRKMDELQKLKLNYLRPDGKAEVSVKYENGIPKAVEKIILAKPFDSKLENENVKRDLYKFAVLPILEKYNLNKIPLNKIVLNGTGKWEIGGPASDTGLTGRKIIVDTYGGMGRIGGGCFSGKDPTKVDRSGAYAARFIAKNIVAAGLADKCEVQLAYVIGEKQPIVKAIETFDTEKKELKTINNFAWRLLDVSVMGIIEGLNLRRPIYKETAKYGHFGNKKFPWEKLI